jgi:hypothetical protein
VINYGKCDDDKIEKRSSRIAFEDLRVFRSCSESVEWVSEFTLHEDELQSGRIDGRRLELTSSGDPGAN